ncbi:MAG: hypothetical protein AAF557_14415 [Pseudomonadota bacterium]
MTDVSQPAGAKGGTIGPIVALAAGVLLIVGLLLLGRSELPLGRSVTGLNGLTGWLRKNDVGIIVFKGRAVLKKSQVGLRIMPIYDTDLLADRDIPEDRDELIAQTSESDLSRYVVRRKLSSLPTLVVLPKWRTGVRALGVAHRDLLIPKQEITRLLRQLGVEGARVTRNTEGFTADRTDLPNGTAEIGLLHAQTIAATNCETKVRYRREPLFLLCGEVPPETQSDGKAGVDATGSDEDGDTNAPESQFWVLTDPDVANNHGLGLAQNAQAMLSIVKSTDFQNSAVLDLSDSVWVEDGSGGPARHERSWDDLARVFAWPFTVIWITFLALAGLVLWRAVTRYGPPAPLTEEEPLAAKTTSIDAKARLLRLANHDAALLTTHIGARLQQLAAELLGPHRPPGERPMAVLLPLVRRANPELAEELPIAAQMPRPGADLLAHLDRFESCYDRIRHEFGRTSGAG